MLLPLSVKLGKVSIFFHSSKFFRLFNMLFLYFFLFSFYFIFHLSLTATILLSRSNLHEFLLLYPSAIIPAGCFSRNNAR